jgi:predicted HicB family RNase H-like nuclease
MSTMSYKGYEAVVEYDEEAGIFHGEVAGLRDVITFQGKSVAELKKTLAGSIEDYLAFCKERGEDPEKPFSGRFVVRADPSLHKDVAVAAKRAGVSLNKWVTSALQKAVGR